MGTVTTLATRLCGISLIIATAMSGRASAQTLYPANYDPSRDGTIADLIHNANYFTDENGKLLVIEHDRVGPRKPYAALGVVENVNSIPVGGGMSAKAKSNVFLISPCFALTNYHSVFGFGAAPEHSGDLRKKFAVRLTMVDETDRMTKVITAVPVEWGNYIHGTSARASDWALLKLDECWGKRVGWLSAKLFSQSEAVGIPLHGSFYPKGEPSRKLTTAIPCTITMDDRSTDILAWRNNCSARPGSSGSPLLYIENGLPYVVGMQAAELTPDHVEAPYSDARANVAININHIWGDISTIVEKDLDEYQASVREAYENERGEALPDFYNPAYDPNGAPHE